MKHIKITLVFLLFLSFAQIATAQVGVSYLHSNVISNIGVSTNPDKRVWGEARINLDVNQFSPEIMGYYSFLQREDFNLFTGVGLNTKVLESFLLPSIGFTVKPFQNIENLAIHAEGSGVFGLDNGNEFARGLIGIRYFIRKKDK